ncbi:hypothetical protein JHK87_052703 [Glycine soja]|nr:hypothetical protein JHK87_052703 [Glycine soja]
MKGCDHGKFQKLHMPCSHVVAACKHVNHEYRNYIHPMYTLGSVSNICRGLFEELCNEAYWPPCHELMISPNPEKKRRAETTHFDKTGLYMGVSLMDSSSNDDEA